jgi:putative Flp pilus-assembly TadE/G-like protein
MRGRFSHLYRDERGISLVYVGAGFMAFMTASTLAIDVGMLMTARNQAQNAADAGALAGAISLAFNSYTNRSSTGPAVQAAINAAAANPVIGASVSVNASDVTFPLDPSGLDDRVQVNVFRTAERSNPVPALMGTLFGLNNVDVSTTATAEAAPADAATCVMPFTIPDKWIEKQDSGGWSPTSTFDMYDKKGNLLSNYDVYRAPGDPAGATGYNPIADRGLEMTLKQSNATKIAPSMYNPYDLPGSSGGDDYRNNIANCNTHIAKIGDNMPPENGDMVGPTKQGVQDLIAKDPNAQWDTTCNCVMRNGNPVATSPRIAVVPLYNPIAYAQGQQSGKGATLTMINFLGFFIEGIDGGGNVLGRITPISGLVSGGGGPTPTGAFPVAIRLVK